MARTLTFEEILNGVTEKIPQTKNKDFSWKAHIDAAKDLTSNIKLNRMVIAEIAERACLIFWGGDVKTEEFKKHHRPHTLKSFAKATGIHHHTLSVWVLVKKRVFDRLPEEEKRSFAFTAGEKTSKALYSNFRGDKKEPTDEEVLSVYSELARPTEKAQRAKRMSQYLRLAAYWMVNKEGLLGAEKEDLVNYRQWARSILEKINEVENIHKMAKPNLRRNIINV